MLYLVGGELKKPSMKESDKMTKGLTKSKVIEISKIKMNQSGCVILELNHMKNLINKIILFLAQKLELILTK